MEQCAARYQPLIEREREGAMRHSLSVAHVLLSYIQCHAGGIKGAKEQGEQGEQGCVRVCVCACVRACVRACAEPRSFHVTKQCMRSVTLRPW